MHKLKIAPTVLERADRGVAVLLKIVERDDGRRIVPPFFFFRRNFDMRNTLLVIFRVSAKKSNGTSEEFSRDE